METVEYKNLKFQVWDLGGQNSIRYYWVYISGNKLRFIVRQYWEMYYPSTNAILYVVDSKDKARFSKAAEELSKVMSVWFFI